MGEGCIPHVMFYNVLIGGCCRRGGIGKGLMLLGDMETKGVLPTMVTYSALIYWLGRNVDPVKIGSLLGEKRAGGLMHYADASQCRVNGCSVTG